MLWKRVDFRSVLEGVIFRRRSVQRTLAWLNRCRALFVRYDKKARNHLGLIQLASAPIWWGRLHKLSHGF